MKNTHVLFTVQAALIAALYVVLTLIANSLGLANYPVQIRFSEALTVLSFFTPAAIPGLFAGCLLSKNKWLAPLPPIAANTLIVPFVLAYVYRFEGSVPYFMLTVGAGEVISCGILGMLLLLVLQKYARHIF